GAAAVLAAGPAPEGIAVPWLAGADPRRLLAPLAARAYRHPDRELIVAGVTGTNGKSTVATLIAAVLEAAGRRAGFLGTLGYRLGGEAFPGERTTPEASDLFRTLRAMRERGGRAVAMEVSSHALEQGRVAGLGFDVAVFTNLTRDHLDYHGSMERYFAAKRRLFALLKPAGRGAVNLDDPWGRRLAADLPDALTYGAGGDVRAEDVRLTTEGIRGTVATPAGTLRLDSPLRGRFNLENLLAAAAAAVALELPLAAVETAFAAQPPVAGRLEPVDRGQPFAAYVDYAHTDAALAAALRSARELAAGRVILVFGCGGDRDAGKRPLMGRVAGELADLPIATSDNPRREDPLAILAAVEEGLRASGSRDYRVVPERRRAIGEAVAAARAGDVVLVAGKGHEAVQVVGDEKLPFSDRDELARAIEERRGAGDLG
ncbi:MAG TPA: UDP-N-acetylmuramoyl-L-alanyl-D-glutamate--2,6-diaminopimelate ligase, partial [Thermoanaerobaculia bacterium]|nr:UDP-N-acetylmuramoyl-L-alanyl-D-glutamate--2,6-diaminopimelate ligase [Thermoanaerobaculia bacterium]